MLWMVAMQNVNKIHEILFLYHLSCESETGKSLSHHQIQKTQIQKSYLPSATKKAVQIFTVTF